MNRIANRPRLIIGHGTKKKEELEQPPNLGALTPDLQPCSPPTFCPLPDGSTAEEQYTKVGGFVVHQSAPTAENGTAVKTSTGEEFTCKILAIDKYRKWLSPYLTTDGHPHVSSIAEVVVCQSQAYAFFPRTYGDLHSYVREKRKLGQEEARRLSWQIVDAVRHCHQNNIVLRDLKLRKFVFTDPERTQLCLDGLEDAIVLEDDHTSDTLTDKHGCPAYVSPEILSARDGYSGKCADLWSLGVMIFTMLVGRYPFHDREPIVLFGKIRRGAYKIPDSVPVRAKCLVRNLLRHEPSERLSAEDALDHPWFTRPIMKEPNSRYPSSSSKQGLDQTVPEMDSTDLRDNSFFCPF